MNNTENVLHKKQQSVTTPLKYLASLSVLLVLVLTACQPAAPTSVSVPTNTPVPTGPPAPTDTPEPTSTLIPTDTPAPTPAETMATPSVTVADQPLVDSKVTIAKVVSNGSGWLVIHADKNGAPGPVLGQTPVTDGENADVVVELASEGRTETLHAMLHTDVGTVGTYEFPGPDTPVSVNGAVVTLAFKVTSGLDERATIGEEVAVKLVNFAFTPRELTVKVGTTVVWTSEDDLPHTVTADDGSFDSGSMDKGNTFSYTFTQAGEYPYYCAFHGAPGGSGMSATIIVTN